MSDNQTSGGITIHVGPSKLQMLQLAGAALSDTPRTDALKAFQEKEYYFSDYAVRLHYFEEFARELERENAALREDKELLDSNTIWLNVDGQPVWFNGCDLRKAIRRAMKEAGDDDIMRQHLNEGGTPT